MKVPKSFLTLSMHNFSQALAYVILSLNTSDIFILFVLFNSSSLDFRSVL